MRMSYLHNRFSYSGQRPSYLHNGITYCGEWQYYLHNGMSYAGKTESLYWNSPLMPYHKDISSLHYFPNHMVFPSHAIDSFTVSLHGPHGRHLPAMQAFACHEGCARGLSVAFEKWQKFPSVIWSHNILQLTQYPLQIMLSQSIFRPANHKEWCQPTGGHVPYPIPSTRLGLFNSLAMPSQCTGNQHNYTLGNHTINYLITLHISQ